MNVSAIVIILGWLIAQGQESSCIVTGHGDVSEREALAQICRETAGRLGVLFDSPAARVALEVKDELTIGAFVRNGVLVVAWPSRARWLAASDKLGFAHDTTRMEEWASESLRHELAHFIWQRTVYGDSTSLGPGDYGTGLPDWLEEAPAIWAEPAESRRQRVARLRELDFDSIPSLTDLLMARHPNAGKRLPSPFTRTVTTISRGWTPSSPDSAVTITRVHSRIEADGHVTVDTARLESVPEASVIDLYFYPLAYAALEYFREIGGDQVISRLVARSKRGARGYDYALGLPDTPSKPSDLNADWRRWLKRRLTNR